MKKLVCLALALVMALGLLTACGGSGGSAETEQKGLAAMIISIPQGDPFLALTIAGMEQMGQEMGIETKVIEALDKSEYSEQVRAMAEAGANPIYVVWDDLANEAVAIAEEFPDTKFVIVDCYIDPGFDNVKTIVVEPQEASFIAGFVASRTTETKHVAWLGSVDQPVINKFRAGFEAGVAYGDPEVKCESLYIGDPNDPNKGSELAKQVIGQGADILMHSANQSGLGVIRACEEMGVLAIGVDEWQGAINEDVVFWSALKDITYACYAAGVSALDGSFKPGLEPYGIQQGAALFDQRDYDKLPAELKLEVDEILAKISSGEIVVPDNI